VAKPLLFGLAGLGFVGFIAKSLILALLICQGVQNHSSALRSVFASNAAASKAANPETSFRLDLATE
jgi:hypothetical protein